MDTQKTMGARIPARAAGEASGRWNRCIGIILALAPCAGLAATDAPAAPATMRTILNFSQSAWVSPAAVVLRSPEEWTSWNEQMAASERAVAPEPLPTGIDWSREVVLVVALGEFSSSTTFALDPPVRSGRSLYFTGRVAYSWTQSFSSPSHVVAIDRRFADAIQLDPAIGVLEDPFGGETRRAKPAGGVGSALAARLDSLQPEPVIAGPSWGALKHHYR